MVNRVTESSPPAFPLFERTKGKTRSRYARPYLDIVGTSCRGTSCRDLARWARSGSDRVVLERPNLATALTQQVDSTKSLLSIVLENAARWGRGVPLKREIRSNLVPRRGKNARLVSLLGNVERSILLIDIEFFEVVPSYWSRTNNPASFFFFFFFSSSTNSDIHVHVGWTWISRYFLWFCTCCQRASGLRAAETRRRFIGSAAAGSSAEKQSSAARGKLGSP